MTVVLFILALAGWLLAMFFLVALSFVSLILGAMQAEQAQNLFNEDDDEPIWEKSKKRTTLWNMNTTKEIPFGD